MKLFIVTTICILTCLSAACAQNATATNPSITNFVITPADTDQCHPVRFTFTIVNNTGETIQSQSPFAGATYKLFDSFIDRGLTALPDRYMVGVSLNGGMDGYPYRWGFQGALQSKGATSIVGYIAFVQTGTYEVTAALLKGGTLVDTSEGFKSVVTVDVCAHEQSNAEPVQMEPIYPLYNGQRGQAMPAYIQDGYLLIPIRSFIDTIHAYIDYRNGTTVIRSPGTELILFPGTTRAILNGIPINLPIPAQIYGGYTYVPIRFVGPFFGTTVYWNPYLRVLYFQGLY